MKLLLLSWLVLPLLILTACSTEAAGITTTHYPQFRQVDEYPRLGGHLVKVVTLEDGTECVIVQSYVGTAGVGVDCK